MKCVYNSKILQFLSLFLLFGFQVYSQQTVSGTVSSEDGEPLIGANILIKGTTQGAVTDIDGLYSIDVEPGQVLVFSYTGFGEEEITVGTETTLNIILQEGQALDEITVVAYGKQKKVTVTGAVAQLKGEDIIKSPATDMSNSLAGRLPGLVVIQTSGEPGYDGARVTIRGQNTLGDNSPLIVIDGIPDRAGGLGRLSPQDIESISVLKDASAAIYGARAANGAIIITTKRGKSGKPTITYDFNQGWTQPTVIPEMSNAVEYANIINELAIYQTVPVNEWGAAWDAIKSTGNYTSPTAGVSTVNATYSPDAIQKHASGSDPWGFPDTDWFADAFKKWSPQSRHSLQLIGGSDKVQYMGSLGYINQDAVYHESATKYQQYNFRLNLDAQVNDYIKTSLGALARREDRTFPTESAGAIFRMLMRGRPTEPEVWPNGKPGPDIENGQNPYVITTNATGYVDDPTEFVQLNGSVEITNPWIEGLSLTLQGSADKSNRVIKRWQTPWELYYWDRQSYESDGVTPLLEPAVRSNFTDPRLSQEYQNTLNTNLTALLNYSTKIGADHSIGLLAGATRETFEGEGFNAFRRNYISPAVDQLFAGGSQDQSTGGSAYDRARLGYFGRVTYDFKEKYLAEFIWRYDGSYIFPEDSRFGFFPGILLGWNITSEDWFNVPGIDYLKLRTSYGEMGNDQVVFNDELQEFAFLSTYGFDEFPIDGVVQTTLNETSLANPDFTWERAKNFNIGIDGTVLSNRLDFTLEYFQNKRDQILIQLSGSTPESSGISSLLPPVNAGKVENSGFEFNLGYNGGTTRGLRFRAGVNGGYAKNKVIFLDEVPGAPDWQRQEGKPIGAHFVYKSNGAFLNQAEIEANSIDYSGVTGQLIPGDLKYEDFNNDGVIDGDDRVRLEEGLTPTFNFGANFALDYKGFDLSALFQGATGASLFIRTESGDIGNYLKHSHDNRWSIENPSSAFPRLASRNDTYYSGGEFGNNDYWLFSKDYIRLKNLELGYTLPQNILNRFKLGSLRIYVNGLNLFTVAGNDIFDPESENSAGTNYPQQRILNTGISVTF